MEDGYRRRLVDPLIDELVAGLPAVSIVGPRASGKTTTARRHARTVVRLDRPDDAAAFQANPDAALRTLTEPVLLDEWQEAAAVLGAVKRSVDADPHPGRYLRTGSVRAELDSQTWPGTGRIIHVPMTGLTVRERLGDFVVAQLRAELPVSTVRPRLHHLRQQAGRQEIDILVGLAAHRVIAIEIKASVSPKAHDGRHLAWLRDELGDRFCHGLVLHTGRYLYPLGDRVTAAPISVLWG